MGQTIQSGNTSITGSATVSFTKSTAIPIVGTISNGSTTLGTVGAGKVWRILSIQHYAIAIGAINFNSFVKLNGVTASVLHVYSTAGVDQQQTISTMWDYYACPVITAGQTVTATGDSVSGETYAVVTYVEESA